MLDLKSEAALGLSMWGGAGSGGSFDEDLGQEGAEQNFYSLCAYS